MTRILSMSLFNGGNIYFQYHLEYFVEVDSVQVGCSESLWLLKKRRFSYSVPSNFDTEQKCWSNFYHFELIKRVWREAF